MDQEPTEIREHYFQGTLKDPRLDIPERERVAIGKISGDILPIWR